MLDEQKKVAILATHGFEEIELTSPLKAMKEAGFKVDIISPESGNIKSWDQTKWGKDFEVDNTVDEVNIENYHGLMLPGGVINPDKLRRNENAVNFVRGFFKMHKPVAAICHGPQMLIEADVVNGRTLTSFPSIKTDLINAGAKWVDKEVVVDNGMVTSRSPKDLEAFNSKLIEEVKEGKHEAQTV